MSAIRWANTVRCDWPAGCNQVATVELGEQWPDRSLPEGWTDFAGNWGRLNLQTWDGARLSEFCPAHGRASLAELVAAAPDPKLERTHG